MAGLFNVLVPFALIAVVIILIAGIYSLFKGGDFSRSYSNKLMRWRVLLQFIAVAAMMTALYFRGS